jgi:3-mercaptopyruvate sulfurtransferase SseA
MRRNWQVTLATIALTTGLAACSSLLPPSLSPGASTIPTEDPVLEVARVTLDEAKAAFDSGAAIFLDVRGQGAYERGHIAGALWIPLADIEARMSELDPNDWIITYCT